MAPQSKSLEFAGLQKSLSSIRALILSLQTALESSSATTLPDQSTQTPNPLAVLADASKLLKAQTTKLSLLVINKPFSPKEVSFILNALSTSVLPGLVSGLELCHPLLYTRALSDHVRTSLRILWREIGSLLSYIPENESRALQVKDKAALASTGLLWEQCDALIEIGHGGLVKFVQTKVRGYGALFEDAITELEDWDPNDDSDDETENGDDYEKTQKDVIRTPTTSDEETLNQGVANISLDPRFESKSRVMKVLRLIKLLYPAIIKRRVKTFPSAQGQDMQDWVAKIQKLDEIVEHTHRFTELADDLAAALYDDVPEDVSVRLEKISHEASRCLKITKLDWQNTEDEFTVWLDKWRERFETVSKAANHSS